MSDHAWRNLLNRSSPFQHMRSNEFQHDEGDAVSPVIATILMVAITVVLAGVLYVWASSLAEGNAGGSLTFYQFDAEGDVGAITTGTDDPLVRITMTQGVAINWATVDVKISINNGAPITCDNPGNEGGAACALIEFGDSTDSEWSVGDGVTVVVCGLVGEEGVVVAVVIGVGGGVVLVGCGGSRCC